MMNKAMDSVLNDIRRDHVQDASCRLSDLVNAQADGLTMAQAFRIYQEATRAQKALERIDSILNPTQ